MQHLAEQYPYFEDMVDACKNNRKHWQQLAEEFETRLARQESVDTDAEDNTHNPKKATKSQLNEQKGITNNTTNFNSKD